MNREQWRPFLHRWSEEWIGSHDPEKDGEWAAYWHASWSGRGLEPFDSFYDVMYGQYTSFHALRN